MAACDAFSAMTTDRSYRSARSVAAALAELRRCAGSQFDPRVVGALLSVVADEPARAVERALSADERRAEPARLALPAAG